MGDKIFFFCRELNITTTICIFKSLDIKVISVQWQMWISKINILYIHE